MTARCVCLPLAASVIFCLTLFPTLSAGQSLDCWDGEYTAARCCDISRGVRGDLSCWNGQYTYETCCAKQAGSTPSAQKVKRLSGESGSSQTSIARRKGPIDGVVVGIDLGTTYSAVSIFRGGRAEVIPNDQGNRITPSVVCFLEHGERLVGESAKNLRGVYPKQTVYDAKRLIGRGFNDRSVQFDKKSFPFRVIDRGGRPHIEVDGPKKKTVVFAPEEISALVLRKMKTTAEAYLGEEVRHAVVTVPAYFTDNQRSATMAAGEIAGLNVVRVLNEPTAAAIAYGLDQRKAQRNDGRSETRVLVYDLGGGTFDVSLLSIDNGVFEVLATSGNTHLGGEDFDHKVVNHIAQQFKARTGKDPTRDLKSMQKLKVAVEGAKRALSTTVSTSIEIDGFLGGHDLQETLTRSKFEHLNSELFSKTLTSVERVLADARLQAKDVDEVVMVGGSTRIPKIQQLIKEFFHLPTVPQHKVNPDEAVAIGAAIQGELLWRGSSAGQALTVGRTSWDVVLVDVTPLSLGIEIHAGHMVVLVPRNTAVPTLKTQTFSTVHDYQTTVYIPIYQGEHTVAKKNNKLGEMILSGIPPAPVGVPQIDVTFRIDANSILHVTAQDKGTKTEASVTINAQKGRLSDEEIERMIKRAERDAERDRELLARRDARASLESYLSSLQSSVLKASELDTDDREAVTKAVEDATAWLQDSQNRKATAADINEVRQSVEQVAGPVVARMYGQEAPPSQDQDTSCQGDTCPNVQEERDREEEEDADGNVYDDFD